MRRAPRLRRGGRPGAVQGVGCLVAQEKPGGVPARSPTPTHSASAPAGTVIEVNVSELGLVTPGGKVVWGKYAQVTNNPENDGCINAVLLV